LSVRFVVAFSIFFLEFLGQAISGKDTAVLFIRVEKLYMPAAKIFIHSAEYYSQTLF